MIRLQEIQSALRSVVGWEQDYNPQNQIDESLCRSTSGLTFQGAHPLVTLENIRSIMPDDFLYKYPVWSNAAYYAKGVKVRHLGKVWEAADANSGSIPAEGSQDWSEYNMLSDYIERLTLNGINLVIQQFIERKQLARETKSLVERRTFFDGAARLTSLIDPSGKIVGMEIQPVRAMGVTTKIERIGLQMIGATGSVRMYLFHSSQAEPIRVMDFDYQNTRGGFAWFTPAEPLYLPYISGGTDAGGAWFLCYNQNDLPVGMHALNVAKDWSKEPCATCTGYIAIEQWKEITKYLQVSPFAIKAPEGFRDNPTMFDIGELAYTNTMNYGINAEISVGCDLTDFIISQRDIFANVIQKQVAVSVLRTLAMNPDVRVNRNQMNVSRDNVLYEIDGNPQGRKTGLGAELEEAYRAIVFDTRGLDRICLSCNNHGVKYRTA